MNNLLDVCLNKQTTYSGLHLFWKGKEIGRIKDVCTQAINNRNRLGSGAKGKVPILIFV